MAPWSTRRLTLCLLFVLVLSMVMPQPWSGLAQDAATPEVTPEVVMEPSEPTP